jgi:hypothetical protein
MIELIAPNPLKGAINMDFNPPLGGLGGRKYMEFNFICISCIPAVSIDQLVHTYSCRPIESPVSGSQEPVEH